MAAQNIISLGIDTTSFSEDKKVLLSEFIGLFDKLDKFDGKTITPVLGVGFAEFNASIKDTSKLLDEINGKIGNIGKASSAGGASKSFTELGLATREYGKYADQAAVNQAKLSTVVSDAGKQAVITKNQLSETTRAIVEESKAWDANTISVQKQKLIDEEYRIEKQRVVATLRALAIEQDKEVALAEKNSAKRLSDQEKLRVITLRDQEAAIRRDQIAEKNLLTDYEKLTVALKEQALAYKNVALAQGVKSPQAKLALGEYANTAAVIGDIDKKLESAQPKAFGLGKGLTSMYNQLRIIAYILPGLGIAGIFNLAFEAIQSATDGLDIFTTSTEKYLKYQVELNKATKEELDLHKQLYEIDKELRKLPEGARLTPGGIDAINQESGIDQGTALAVKESTLQFNLQKTTSELISKGLAPEALKSDLDRRLQILRDYTKNIDELDKRITSIESPKPGRKINERKLDVSSSGSYYAGQLENLKKEKEIAQSKLDAEKSTYKQDKELLDKYQSDQENYFKVRAEIQKFNLDEERRRTLAFAKDEIAIIKEKNELILKDEITSESNRIAARKKIAEENVELLQAELNDVNNNPTSTASDKEIARDKFNSESKINTIKLNEDIENIRESYYQRRLKAIATINKNEVESEALKNESIFKNDQKSLNERLAAFTVYITKKQSLEEIELQRTLKEKSLRSDDPTVRKEIEALRSSERERQVAIQADTEKHVYDIVSSSLKLQLKAVIQENQYESQENKIKYTEELKRLNDLNDAKKISYRNYSKEVRELQKKYNVDIVDDKIKDDEADIQRLKNLLDTENSLKKAAKEKTEGATAELDYAKSEGNDTLNAQRRYDEAVGNEEAIDDAILELKKDLKGKTEDLEDDLLKKELARIEKRKQAEKEYYNYRKQILEALAELAQTIGDSQYEKQLENLEKRKNLADEAFDSESAAIGKSTLDAKNKAALDIQLTEQKKEYDKNVAKEEKKIKHDQAIFDREINIVKIIANTQQAASKALAEFPFPINQAIAAEAYALGAIQVATVLATRIPSYALGTKDHPGGLARFGEAGVEEIREPHRSPYYVSTETISYLPKGTQVVPVKETVNFKSDSVDNSWEQTRWLAYQMRKNNKEIKNVFKPVINVDLGFQNYKRGILGNG